MPALLPEDHPLYRALDMAMVAGLPDCVLLLIAYAIDVVTESAR